MLPLAMEAFYGWLAVALAGTMATGLARVVVGPKPADRMLGTQLFGTTGVALLLVMAELKENEALRNVALVFVVLTLLTLIAFVERTPPGADHASS
jgi:multicomponent Na+:H+ antiporter subunit F